MSEADQFKSYIGGYSDGSGDKVAWESPVHRDARLSFVSAGDAEVDRAVTLAASAQRAWDLVQPLGKQAMLNDFAGRIEADFETLAMMDCIDMGKPIAVARQEVHISAFILRFYAGAIDKTGGFVVPSAREALVLSTWRPRGVVGAMISWNYPLINALMKVGPALAAGNAVVLKPSEQSPRSAVRLAELAAEAGLPEGLLSVLCGAASTGGALCRHPGLDMIAFTGSTQTGRRVAQYAAELPIPTLIEAGGKNPILVCDDITDLEAVARDAIKEAYENSGQLCVARSKILVPRSLETDLCDALATAAADFIPGDALNEATAFGPLSSLPHANRVVGAIDRALSAGATMIRDGRIDDPFMQGVTVLRNSDPEADLFREEYFGPVLAVGTFDDLDTGIDLANAGGYGLAATVWTCDLARANYLNRALAAGHIKVKAQADVDAGTGMALPIEPAGKSGFGTEFGVAALESYARRHALELQGFGA